MKKEKSNLYSFIQTQAESALTIAKNADFPHGTIGNMLGAFSCELYLKIILGAKEPIKGHNLKELFDLIEEKDKDTIKEIYCKKKGEGYYVLYDNIIETQTIKDFMDSSYSSIGESLDAFCQKMRNRPPEEIKNGFRKLDAKESFLFLLERDKSAFIDSRYFYEKSGHYNTDNFVIEFAEVLQEFVNNSKYRLLW